jgi:ribonucleoside-diphosphate reductase alpha chain
MSLTHKENKKEALKDEFFKKLRITKRDKSQTEFDRKRIYVALAAAFKDHLKMKKNEILDAKTEEVVDHLCEITLDSIYSKYYKKTTTEVESIQDHVELVLMDEKYHQVARKFILYREERRRIREAGRLKGSLDLAAKGIKVDIDVLYKKVKFACKGLEDSCSVEAVIEETKKNLYPNISEKEISQALLLSARTRIEKEPNYTYVTARLLLDEIYQEVLDTGIAKKNLRETYKKGFSTYLEKGVKTERLSEELLKFDLEKISDAIEPKRDFSFQYLGLQTVYDRYLLRNKDELLEVPQYFWMRVAMGLAIQEEDREKWAIEFYNVLSRFDFVSSTPTLFNSGTRRSQLSSCYLSTVDDSIEGIFKIITDNAQLSKWAGGLGNDWTNIRATGSLIKGTNGLTQGVIPFLKIVNDTAVAVNQGGKRKGAVCCYLETWHLDIEEFLELRKNTGDERRRAHDMNTANWIPDLFMKRVQSGGMWTLFSPNDVPDLHDSYGKAFEEKYLEYERKAEKGEIKLFRRLEATSLWRKMLSMLFETGHPWITFKDPSNIRSPQDHCGVVHSSNLCTEILLNTSKEETAVCNLGSVNLVAHFNGKQVDNEKLEHTVTTAMRMLDNVVDINFYPTAESKTSNQRHRPVGLGIMGFQDCLYKMRCSYASKEAVEFADKTMELVSYYAILGSTKLSEERGAYSSYKGSKWDRGLVPLDTLQLLVKDRGESIDVNTDSSLDWDLVRKEIKKHGMRNSNTMAIAPTATISNIIGVSPTIEPTYAHLYVKSNLSGEFTWLNPYLVEDLKERDLWNDDMLDDLKYTDGSLEELDQVPEEVKHLYPTAFEIEPQWLIDAGSRRQKWIDMGQSLNLFMNQPSGKKLNEMYFYAWLKGLKTTYYCRTLAATKVEKSTQDINKRSLQPRWMKSKSPTSNVKVDRNDGLAAGVKACSLLDPDCESCQ